MTPDSHGDQPAPSLASGFDAGLDAWADAVRKLAATPEFCCVLPAPEVGPGFPIVIERAGGTLSIAFGGLVHDCDGGIEEALAWTRRAWTPGWQLRVDSVGGRPVRWTLENGLDPLCPSLSSGHIVWFGRWRSKDSVTLCNTSSIDLGLMRRLGERAADAVPPLPAGRRAAE